MESQTKFPFMWVNVGIENPLLTIISKQRTFLSFYPKLLNLVTAHNKGKVARSVENTEFIGCPWYNLSA